MRALLRSRLRTVALMTFGLSLVMAAPASAHNEFVSSSPAEGAVLAESPTEWLVTFTKEVPLDSASGEIVGPDGSITTLASPTHGASTSEIRFALPTTSLGVNTARWRLVSVDGHVISGRVSFTVGESSGTANLDGSGVLGNSISNTVGDPPNPAPEPVRWGVRLIGYFSLLALGGLLVAELHLVEGVFGALRGRPLIKIIAGFLVGAPLLQMLFFLGDVFGTSVFGALTHLTDAFDTTPGSMFAVRTMLGGVLAYQLLTVLQSKPTSRDHRLIVITGVLYVLTQAYTGHSRSRSLPLIGIPADTVHLIAASVWLGGLAVLVFVVAPLLETRDLWRSFERYGQVAKIAVIALVITGIIQTLRLHGGIGTLFTQSHGQLLLLKIIVVAIMLRLGDLNRRRMTTKIKDNPNLMDKRLALVVRMGTLEVATGAVVLAITAALVTASFS